MPSPSSPPAAGPRAPKAGMAALALGALGVVFGDIGTSPLYALHAVFGEEGGVQVSRAHVYGIISLVVWSITVVVSIKYVAFVLRADNDGEGGIMALIALLKTIVLGQGKRKALLIGLGIFGAALFYGDSMITPAISVLSAVEGLEVAAPGVEALIVPIAVVILTALFAIQRFGTSLVGRLFGPVMIVWFGVLAIGGGVQIAGHPEILEALSPTHGAGFFLDEPGVAFLSLGAVVLTITGAEALYADMGHFGRGPIRRAWFLAVFPALTLNYLGQGALILDDERNLENPFFLLFPDWAGIPMVVLATLATVIASQAVISGAFSVTRQAIQLGFVPRLSVRQTSAEEIGQVYLPAVNGGLYVIVVALVVGFGSSAALAAAYGIAVTGTLAIDTILFCTVMRTRFRRPLPLVLLGGALFLTVDLAFLGANVPKIDNGGWFPLVVALLIFGVLMTWQRGRRIVTRNRTEEEGPLSEFVRQLRSGKRPVTRVPGTAVFLHPGKETTPLAMRANVEHNRVLHESVVILSIETLTVPYVTPADRLEIDELGYKDDGITHVHACLGFMDRADVPALLRQASKDGLERPIDVDGASYFLSRMTINATRAPGMATPRKKLFVAMARNATSPVEYFALPVERVVTVGSYVDL